MTGAHLKMVLGSLRPRYPKTKIHLTSLGHGTHYRVFKREKYDTILTYHVGVTEVNSFRLILIFLPLETLLTKSAKHVAVSPALESDILHEAAWRTLLRLPQPGLEES